MSSGAAIAIACASVAIVICAVIGAVAKAYIEGIKNGRISEKLAIQEQENENKDRIIKAQSQNINDLANLPIDNDMLRNQQTDIDTLRNHANRQASEEI